VLDLLGGALTLVLAAAIVRVSSALLPRLPAFARLDLRASRAGAAVRGACHKVVTKSPTG
jgi:hypothetical protein